MMLIKYFSWIREGIGLSEEHISCPDSVHTVSDLLNHLAQQSDAHARVLNERVLVRVAVNQQHASHTSSVSEDDEIAVFPPVTGG